MYILEIIAKLFLKKKKMLNSETIENNDNNCSHIFLPVDSTADYLACNKCGFVIKNNNNKDINPFKK